MIDQLKITIAQLNPILGNIDCNVGLMINSLTHAKFTDADLVIFPELSITGYPTEDLVLKPVFQKAAFKAVEELAQYTLGAPAILVGFPYEKNGLLFNAVGLLEEGKIAEIRFKHELPNYGVFDEKRLFSSAPLQNVINFKGVKLGLPICEDIWLEKVAQHLKQQGAEILISPNCSPFAKDKVLYRQEIMEKRVAETGLPLIYVNQVGGQDELVFDGASFVLDNKGNVTTQLSAFIESIETVTFIKNQAGEWQPQIGNIAEIEIGLAGVYHACVLGLRDYVQKNRFPSVLLGLSGGVDSAICAAIAVDALGEDKVHCVMLPYDYTSDESLKDAKDCADSLGV